MRLIREVVVISAEASGGERIHLERVGKWQKQAEEGDHSSLEESERISVTEQSGRFWWASVGREKQGWGMKSRQGISRSLCV